MPILLINLTKSNYARVFNSDQRTRLESLCELTFFDPATNDPSPFPQLVAAADVMLTGWGSRALSAADVEARTKPLLIAHSAGSVRGICPKDALHHHVRLTQGASAIAPAVAQYTVGLIIMALRQAVARNVALKSGQKYGGDPAYFDLTGITVGLVGLSQVGRRVPPLLKPFECKVVACDPMWTQAQAAELGVRLLPDFDAVIDCSQVISLHAPVLESTTGMLNADRIARLRPGTVVVNTARARLVDQTALFARAMAGDIQVYTDVTDPEPLPPDHIAWSTPNIFITPHIAGVSQQTLERLATISVAEIERFLTGQPLQTEITFDRFDLLA